MSICWQSLKPNALILVKARLHRPVYLLLCGTGAEALMRHRDFTAAWPPANGRKWARVGLMLTQVAVVVFFFAALSVMPVFTRGAAIMVVVFNTAIFLFVISIQGWKRHRDRPEAFIIGSPPLKLTMFSLRTQAETRLRRIV
jgi:4-amino-4-deoxy-L-arabinose transferase-like glycosyltransferase